MECKHCYRNIEPVIVDEDGRMIRYTDTGKAGFFKCCCGPVVYHEPVNDLRPQKSPVELDLEIVKIGLGNGYIEAQTMGRLVVALIERALKTGEIR